MSEDFWLSLISPAIAVFLEYLPGEYNNIAIAEKSKGNSEILTN